MSQLYLLILQALPDPADVPASVRLERLLKAAQKAGFRVEERAQLWGETPGLTGIRRFGLAAIAPADTPESHGGSHKRPRIASKTGGKAARQLD